MSESAKVAQTPGATAAERTPARARREAVLDERKRAFLRMASHELRTPLNSILGFSEIIAAELYGPLGAPQYREYAAIIRSSGQRLLKLVNEILEIARLEGHAIGLDVAPELLDHALDDVLDGLNEDIIARGTQIHIIDRGSLPAVATDPRGLRTVLTHLIQNAVSFSPDGAQVRIRATVSHGGVDVFIMDDGPGADPADLPRLLRPFEQGDTALTRRSEGAGLGLPICQLLCQAMGGRLQLRSAPGQGFTAHFRLPAA